MKNNDIKKELQELSPLLSTLKEQQAPFRVPEGYFDTLQDDVWIRIQAEQALPEKAKEAQASKWASILSAWQVLLSPRLAITFATLTIVITAGIFWFSSQEQEIENPLAMLTASEAAAYIQENIHEFDTELLIQVSTTYPDLNIILENNLNEKEIEQYLQEVIDELDDESLEDFL